MPTIYAVDENASQQQKRRKVEKAEHLEDDGEAHSVIIVSILL